MGKEGGGGVGRKEWEREVHARLASLADIFLRFFLTAEPVHRLQGLGCWIKS